MCWQPYTNLLKFDSWMLCPLEVPKIRDVNQGYAGVGGGGGGNIIGIKICCWALVQIYSQDVGVCCLSWGRQGRSFATNTSARP